MNSSMNTIPFFTNMGFHLASDILITKDTNNPAAQELSIHLNYIHKELHANWPTPMSKWLSITIVNALLHPSTHLVT